MPGQPQLLRGVGGWLMFFVICITILGPLCSLFLVIVFLMAAGTTINTDSALSQLFAAFALVIIAYTVWGLFAGVALWKVRPGAVRQVKQFLMRGAIPFTFVFNLLPFLILPPSHRSDQLGSSAFGGIVFGVAYALIWNSYFTKSVRVANTYPQG